MTRWLYLLCSLLLVTNVAAQELRLHLPEPRWELDADTRPLQEREAGLEPHEAALAAQLRPLLATGSHLEAIAILEQADHKTFSAALYFILGQLYLAESDFTKAESAYLATLEKMPDFLRAHRALGVIYLQGEQFAKAREHLTRALALGANDAQIHGQLGYLNLQDGQPFAALAPYRQALALEPDSTQWQQGLLQALIGAGDLAPARALLDQLLRSRPDDAALWLQSGNIALRAGEERAALAALEMALRLGETQPGNQALVGQLHLRGGSRERGVALLETVLRQDGADYAALAGSVDWLLHEQRWDEAARLTQAASTHAATLDSASRSQLLTQEARIGLGRGKTDQARTQFEQALTLNPANGEALLGLAALEEPGNPARAASLYSRAQALDTYRERALLAHAVLAVAQQEYASALDLLEQARTLAPARRDIADNIAVLERLLSLRRAGHP